MSSPHNYNDTARREPIPAERKRAMMSKVKFYWFASYKVWEVRGKDIEEITEKCHSLCEKYHAIHFEVLI